MHNALFFVLLFSVMLKLYFDKGEKGPRQAWMDQKKQVSKEAADKVFQKSESIRDKIEEEKKRKAKKDALQAAAASRKRNAQSAAADAGAVKKPKKERKKKEKKNYLGKRIAKAFEQEGEDGKTIHEIFFGTIDQLSSKEGEIPVLWHVQVSSVEIWMISCLDCHLCFLEKF